MRIGHGYDVHQFAEGRPLVLGGVHIEHSVGLAGHSDADVLTHALMDALLSAARLGDIGELFPDTDSSFKNICSLTLLERVYEAITHAGFEIVDIDLTLALQEPKIAPYKTEIKATLAKHLRLKPEHIGFKATTTEGLGFVGKKEGAEAWAVVLLDDCLKSSN